MICGIYFDIRHSFGGRSPVPSTVMAASKPVIVVVHATSKQGTSVVNSLLQTGKFTVKAITRDANSDSAPRRVYPFRANPPQERGGPALRSTPVPSPKCDTRHIRTYDHKLATGSGLLITGPGQNAAYASFWEGRDPVT